MYSVVCDTGTTYMVVESFISRQAAEQFAREMQSWFAIPLRIKKIMKSGSLLLDKRAKSN
ncbi:MAG: hypothetical protein LUQ40_06840 [Methanomicrobiales archaeon]|nr:hypothetical protein [Methanomicrobiales archaeon]